MVLQVGTTNFQSTAGESSRRPVNTFVEPVTVVPKTSLMGLAETLSDINPTLQKFVNFEIQKAKQEGILEGQNQLLNADPVKLKEIKKQLEEKEGKLFARNFLGGNVYTQYGIEKQLAINLGNASEAKTTAFFKDYTVDGIPLSQFDVSSKEFQKAIRDFEATSLTDTRGIRPEILNQFFFPKQNAALAQFYSQHQNDLAEAKLEQAAVLLEPAILNSWFQIENINKQIELNIIDNDGFTDGYNYSLNSLQNSIDDYVSRGLSSLVSPAKMLTYMENNMLKIFEYYEDNNLDMELAYEEIEDYVEWIGALKVGPAQQPLSTFYVKDGENKVDTMLKNIFEKKEQVIKNQQKFDQAFAERKILNTLNSIDFTNSNMTLDDYKVIGQTLEDLVVEFPDNIEFTYQQYDLKNINVDNYFFDIREDFDGGSLNQTDALKKAQEFMLALGPAASDADRTTYKNLKEHINKSKGKSFKERFPEVKVLQDIAAKKLGQKSGPMGFSFTTKDEYVDKEIDLNQELRKRVNEAGGVTPEIKDWYRGEIRKILNNKSAEEGGYDFYDDLNNFSIEIEQPFIKENNQNLNKQNVEVKEETNETLNKQNTEVKEETNENLNKQNIEEKDQYIKNKETIEKNKNLRNFLLNEAPSSTNGTLIAMADTSNGIQNIPLLDTYTVVSGDTISSIADKYKGVTMQDIINYNNFDTKEKQDNIQIGQKIKIPKIEIQESSGQITSTIETKTELWNQFNGAAEYGSGDRKTDLEDRDDYLTTLNSGHAYANTSSENIQQELKKIYADIFYSNDKESIEIKNAIVNMVLTEADLSDLNDIAGVVQSIFARVARARLNDSKEAFSSDIIEELMRQELDKNNKLVPMYEGLVGFTREQITSNKPIKETQETFNRIFDILWKETPTKK